MKGSGGRGCERWQEALSASIDGELGGRERRALEAHLAECDACRARRARLSRVASLVGLLAPEGDEARAGARFVERLERRLAAEPPPERAASGRTRPLAVRRARWPAALRSLARIAAAVAVVVTAGWWAQVLYHRLRRPERTRTPVVWRSVASEAQRPGRGGGHTPPRTGAASKLAAAPRTPQPPEIGGQPREDEGGAGATDREAVAHANEPPPRDPAAAAVAEREPAVAGAGAAQRRSETARRERERGRALARARRLARRIADRRVEEDERIAAVYELARLAPRLAPRHPEALRPLERILARPDAAGATLWHETVRAVGTFPSRHTLPWLLAAAEHDPAACARALARLHDPALQRWLAERGLVGLRGHETPLRVAVRALGRLRCRDAAEPIVRLLETSRSARVRVACLAALRDLGAPVAQRAALGALEDPSAPVRVAAARLLARVPSSAASGPLAVRLAAERSAAVRIAIAQALGACGGEPAREALERLRERDRSLSVRGAALLSLQRLDGVGLFADEPAADPTRARGGASARDAVGFGLPGETDGVCILLDRSRSMAGLGRFERARAACDAMLASLSPRSRFTIAVFDDAVRFPFGARLRAARPEAVAQARRWLRAQRPGGRRTDLGAALRAAFSVRGVAEILVVSDGVPTEGLAGARLLEWVRERTWRGERRVHAAAVLRPEGRFRLVGPEQPVPAPLELLRELGRETGGVFLSNGG